MSRLRLGVVFGGRSVEHEVSVVTGYQVIEAADRAKYDVIPVYIGRDNVWYIGEPLDSISFFRQEQPPLNRLMRVLPAPDASTGKLQLLEAETGLLRKPKCTTLDVVLPATHGTFGEDGSLQGLLDMAGVPYTGSNVRGSAVGMDKEMTKAALAAAGLPHLPYRVVHRSDWEKDNTNSIVLLESAFPYPHFIKPVALGSSVAVGRAGDRAQLITALDLALRFSDRALVEPSIDGATEINCAVLDGDPPIASVLEQPMRTGDLLSFEEKYKGGGKKGAKGSGMAGQQRLIPAPLPNEQAELIKSLAVKTFEAIGAGGVARVDFIINRKGDVFVNELNNIPGSLAFYLWEPLGKTFKELIDRLVERAIEVNRRRNRTTFTFEANLLASR